MQDHAEHDISKCIHLIDIFDVFFASESMRTGCSHSSGEHHFNPRSKICMTITYFWRQESSYNPPSHKPIGILPHATFWTSNHETSHNPSMPQKQKSLESFHDFPTCTFSLSFFRSLWSMTTLPFAAITELVATTGTVPSGSSSEERESLSRCQLHVGYLQADYQTYVFYLVSLWYTSFSTTPLMIVLTKHVFL